MINPRNTIIRLSSILVFLLSLILPVMHIKAQTCCSGGVPISANLGLPPSFKGTWQFGLTYNLNSLQTLKEGTMEIEDNSRQRRTHSLILITGYAVTDRFSVEALLPYVWQQREVNQASGFTDFEQTKGIGDLMFLFKYRVTSIKNTVHVLSLGAGPKLATGSSDEVNKLGLTLNADLQPGSGATDLILWGNYLYNGFSRPSMSFYSVFTYRATGINHSYLGSSSYEIGDSFRILGGLSDQYVIGSTIVNASLGARYRFAQQDKFEGSFLPSTGGDWVFLIPGVGATITPGISLETNVEIPLYANPNGTQLSPTYRFNLGLYYIIGKAEDF